MTFELDLVEVLDYLDQGGVVPFFYLNKNNNNILINNLS